jgi:nitrate reductase gamma subunit
VSTNTLLFGYYPYVAAVVFLVGSLVKTRQSLASWHSGTAEPCHIGLISRPSKLFHVTILGLLLGHTAGMLVPYAAYQAVGISASIKQLLAIFTGGSFGLLCLAGLLYYLHRRLTDPEKRAHGTTMDLIVLLFIGLVLVLGLMTLPVSWAHSDGSQLLILSQWAIGILTFKPGAADLLINVSAILKWHIFFGISFFVLIPFSHLPHMWTVPLRYLLYPDQFVLEGTPRK